MDDIKILDRRIDMPIQEAINRLERVVSDNCEDLRKIDGGYIYADELMSAWKKILNETNIQMFKAILLVCTLVNGSGDKLNCWEIHDTLSPNGYATERKCMVRIDEMAIAVRNIIYPPYKIQYKCEKKFERT